MTEGVFDEVEVRGRRWIRTYYFTRAAFSVAWVVLAFTVARDLPAVAAAMLVGYPAWDAVANVVDAQRSGGWRRNPAQAINAVVSAVTTAAVAVALGVDMFAVIGVFGVWASSSGLLQLAAAIRRWRTVGAQWAMALSGAQSALVGITFLVKANGSVPPGITDIAPYAAFGAFYFLVSALWLVVSDRRRVSAADAG